MLVITNLKESVSDDFSPKELISVNFSKNDLLEQIDSIQYQIDTSSSLEDVKELERIIVIFKSCCNSNITMPMSDWQILNSTYALYLSYPQLAEIPQFIKAGLCPEIYLEIDVDGFRSWLEESVKSELWDIEEELMDKIGSENASYLGALQNEVNELANNLNGYRALDALHFFQSGGKGRMLVNNRPIYELFSDCRNPEEKYIFETLNTWLCDVSGYASEKLGLIFFSK